MNIILKKKFSTYSNKKNIINENYNNNFIDENFINDTTSFFLQNTINILEESYNFDIRNLNEDFLGDINDFKKSSSGWLSSLKLSNLKDAAGKAMDGVKGFLFGRNASGEVMKNATDSKDLGMFSSLFNKNQATSGVADKMKDLGSSGLSGKISQLGTWMQNNQNATLAGLAGAGLLGTYFLFKKWRSNKNEKANENDIRRAYELNNMSQAQLGSMANRKITM